jgi:Fe-S cluster biogenesis protein NfuA
LKFPSALPRRPDKVEFPFARCRTEFKGFSIGDFVLAVIESPEWEDNVGRLCDEIDRTASLMSITRRLYASRELEKLEILRRILGLEFIEEARQWPSLPENRGTRRKLGFDDPRDHIHNRHRPRQLARGDDRRLDGVPSESTVRRHERRISDEARAAAYDKSLSEIIPAALAESKEFREEARIVGGDGSAIRTHYKAPIFDRKTGEIVKPERVTAPEAGYMPESAGKDKSGDGWSVVTLMTMSGLPLGHRVIKIHQQETPALLDILRTDYRELVAPKLDHGDAELSVLSGDGAFSFDALRSEARGQGMVENVHRASHRDAPESRRNVKKLSAQKISIEGKKDWYVNGHFELFCRCGGQEVFQVFKRSKGRAVVRLEGRCKHGCGRITITSGRWRKVQNPTRFVKVQPGEKPELKMGNPLTYHSKLGKYYGDARFAYQEGMNGVLERGYALLRDKRWFRTEAQAKLEVAMVYFVVHALARKQRRLKSDAAAHSGAPPGPCP